MFHLAAELIICLFTKILIPMIRSLPGSVGVLKLLLLLFKFYVFIKLAFSNIYFLKLSFLSLYYYFCVVADFYFYLLHKFFASFKKSFEFRKVFPLLFRLLVSQEFCTISTNLMIKSLVIP